MSNQQDFENLIARIEAATQTLEADVTLINNGTSSMQDLVDQAEQAVLDAQAQANLAANQVSLAQDEVGNAAAQAGIAEGHAEDSEGFAQQAEAAYQAALQAIADLEAAVILEEAPEDGQQYARQDGGWSVVTGGGGTGEWDAETISQAEAEAGTATTRRAFTAQRVRQAIVAWWNSIGTTVGKAILNLANPSAIRFLRINADNTVTARSDSEMRTDLGLGTAATANVTTSSADTTTGRVLRVGDGGLNGSTLNLGPQAIEDLSGSSFFGFSSGDNPAGASGAGQGVHIAVAGQAAGAQLFSSRTSTAGSIKIFYRTKTNQVWSDSTEIYHSAKLSSDVNTMLDSSNNAAIRSNIGLGDAATQTMVTGTGDTTGTSVPTVEWVQANAPAAPPAPVWNPAGTSLHTFRNEVLRKIDAPADFDDIITAINNLGFQGGMKAARMNPSTDDSHPNFGTAADVEFCPHMNAAGTAIIAFTIWVRVTNGTNIGKTYHGYRTNDTPRPWAEFP